MSDAATRTLRDHNQPCEHGEPDKYGYSDIAWDMHGEFFGCDREGCPGGREVTINYEAAHFMLRALYRETETVESAQRASAIVDAALGVHDD